MEARQTDAVLHGGRDRHQVRILLREPQDGGREHIRPRPCLFGRDRLSRFDHKGRCPVKSGRIFFRRPVSHALFRADMDQDCLVDALCVLDGLDHIPDIVSVDRPQIGDPHLLKEHSGHHQGLERLLGPADPLRHLGERLIERVIHAVTQLYITGRSPDLTEIFGDPADVPGDRHVVVIENDDQIGGQARGIVERLVGKTSCHGAVSDHSDDGLRSTAQLPGPDHAQRGTDRGGAVPRVVGVTAALLPLGKAAHSAQLPQGVKPLPASRQQFMRIRLMAHIPDDPVSGKVQGQMKGHGQFNRPEVAGQVTAGDTHLAHQKLTYLLRKISVFLRRDLFYIIGFMYQIKQSHACISSCPPYVPDTRSGQIAGVNHLSKKLLL